MMESQAITGVPSATHMRAGDKQVVGWTMQRVRNWSGKGKKRRRDPVGSAGVQPPVGSRVIRRGDGEGGEKLIYLLI